MKGQKTGGRQKGTPNKATKEIRDFFTNFFNDNKELFTQDILSLEPMQRLSILPKIMPFVMPKAPAETEDNDNQRFISRDAQNRFLAPGIDVWRNVAENIRSSMNEDNEEQEPLQGTPFSSFVTSDTISNCDTTTFYGNEQHLQSSASSEPSEPSDLSAPSGPSAPSDYSDYSASFAPSDYSDFSNYSAQSDSSALSAPSDYSENSDYSNPSDLSDPSASSDPSKNSSPSNNPAPSLKPTPKHPTPHTPFYKTLNTSKTHNKRRKRR